MPEDSENSTEMTMADYSVLCENQQIEIGKAGENLARSCTIDYSAWLKEYGEGDLRIRAIRSGDAEPYPVTNVTTENGVATWIFTDADTAVKGYGEVQILYYVEDVLVKSRVWRTYTHRSLSTSSEEVPDPYQDWLSEVERIGNQIEEDAESASDSATRAAGSASEAAESALSATRSESSAQEYASEASTSAASAASSASAASQSASEASTYEYYSEQYMNEAKSARFSAESARTGAENAKTAAQTAATESEASATAAAQSAAQAEEAAESIEASADLIQKLLANQIHDTATGTIASFPDGADMPMVSLVADIDPIQDTSGGAPSPSNICPISGWDSVDVSVCGINVWDEEWEVGGYDMNTGAKISVNIRIRSVNKIDVRPNTSYYFHMGNGTGNILYYDANDAFISRRNFQSSSAFTTPNNCYRIAIAMANDYGTTYNNDISINYPSTDTDYHAYTGQTYQTTLPQTVYGGTLDVVSGVLTVDRAMVTLNGQTTGIRFTEVSQTTTADGQKYVAYIAMASHNIKNNNIAICDAYAFMDKTPQNMHMGEFDGRGSYFRFVIADQNLNTLALWNAHLAENPMTLVYELATPTTIQLTPQQIDSLLGRNNVWADSGDVTVEYIADTKLYIQKVMGAIG